jgi:hypothetical protein
MTLKEYLKHADECDRLAALAKLDANKHALRQSAEMWRRLAAAGSIQSDGTGTDLKPLTTD